MQTLKQKQDAVFKDLENIDQNSNVSIVSAPGDYQTDSRMCLTFIYFPSEEIKERIQKEIIEQLKQADPSQHYLHKDALHITIQTIRDIADPQTFTEEDIEKAKGLSDFFQKQKLSFDFNGLLKMPSSVFVKGFPDDKTQEFILELRKKLIEIGTPDDRRYIDPDTVIGNMTLCRFYKQPNQEFLKTFERIKDIELGRVNINKISLVKMNAVCARDSMEVLKEFNLQ